MTREEAVKYLDKMAEARKALNLPPNPEVSRYLNETFPLLPAKSVHLFETRVLMDALGFPVVFRKRDDDTLPWEMYFFWKGVKFFSIHTDADMMHRLRKNACSGLHT